MLIDNLRTALNQARKERNSTRAMVLSTLIGEMMASAVVKDGQKVVTDKVVVATLKQAGKNLDDNIQKGYGSIDAQSNERKIIDEFIPEEVPLMSETETQVALNEAKASGANDMKTIMAYMKTNYAGRYDGKLTSNLAKEMI